MITITKQEKYALVSFEETSRFNAQFALQVKQDIISLFDYSPHVIIDLSYVKYIDSGGFGAIISILKVAKEKGGRLLFCNISREVLDLIEIMQLHMIFEIYTSIEDAVKACK